MKNIPGFLGRLFFAAGLLSVAAPLMRPTRADLHEGRPEETFPAIFSPRFVSAGVARIGPQALVLGCANGGEAHAYSLRLLDGHEIVNDTVGNQALVAGY